MERRIHIAPPPPGRTIAVFVCFCMLLVVAGMGYGLKTTKWLLASGSATTGAAQESSSYTAGLFQMCLNGTTCADVDGSGFQLAGGCSKSASELSMRYWVVRGLLMASAFGAFCAAIAAIAALHRPEPNALTDGKTNAAKFCAPFVVFSCACAICGVVAYAVSATDFFYCGDLCPWLQETQAKSFGGACSSEYGTGFVVVCVATAVALVNVLLAFLLLYLHQREQPGEKKQLDEVESAAAARREPVSTPARHGHDAVNKELAKINFTNDGVAADRDTMAGNITPQVGETGLPEGDWQMYSSGEGGLQGLFWSEETQLFFHKETNQYFEPKSGMWYDPDNREWYREE